MWQRLERPVSVAPLAFFRFLFGALMLASTIRFATNGWIHDLYILPKHHFTYYGFSWVKALGDPGMYILFLVVGLSALLVMLGLFYRVAAVVFFLSFTYVELIDVSTYLNHYYFVSLVALLMIFLPAHRYFSLDVLRKPSIAAKQVPAWSVNSIKLLLGMVYVFAGIAKLNPDWLMEAQPLKIWLAPKSYLPIIGPLMDETWVAYAFSWFGCFYDLTIPFFLMLNKTRNWAYVFVVAFHLMTAFLFPIGMFPYVMILSTLIFFPATAHEKWIHFVVRGLRRIWSGAGQLVATERSWNLKGIQRTLLLNGLLIFFAIQLLLPFRYVLYPGQLFWTEQGYRFSWRVMLTEKAGAAFFYVKDPAYPGEVEIRNSNFLSPLQEKMMATQPDLILQYAKIIEAEYQKQGIADPIIRAEIWVALNGNGSRPFIDPTIDLTTLEDSWSHKDWILPYEAK